MLLKFSFNVDLDSYLIQSPEYIYDELIDRIDLIRLKYQCNLANANDLSEFDLNKSVNSIKISNSIIR